MVDRRGVLDENIFAFTTAKNGTVFISYHGKRVTTLAGDKAQSFLRKIEGADDKTAQLVMAKATGNFKRGNEKLSKG